MNFELLLKNNCSSLKKNSVEKVRKNENSFEKYTKILR